MELKSSLRDVLMDAEENGGCTCFAIQKDETIYIVSVEQYEPVDDYIKRLQALMC